MATTKNYRYTKMWKARLPTLLTPKKPTTQARLFVLAVFCYHARYDTLFM